MRKALRGVSCAMNVKASVTHKKEASSPSSVPSTTIPNPMPSPQTYGGSVSFKVKTVNGTMTYHAAQDGYNLVAEERREGQNDEQSDRDQPAGGET